MARRVLEHAQQVLATTTFDHDSLDQALRAAASELGLKAGQTFQPIRVAVCGRKNAPPLFETMVVLGREVCLERIGKAAVSLNLSSEHNVRRECKESQRQGIAIMNNANTESQDVSTSTNFLQRHYCRGRAHAKIWRRPSADAVPSRAERLPAHRPRQSDLPRLWTR